MPRVLQSVLLIALGLSFAPPLLPVPGARAESPDQIPNPRVSNGGWVADLADVLSDAAERQINSSIEDLKRERGAEIAVVTVKNTDDYDPKEFATELFNRARSALGEETTPAAQPSHFLIEGVMR